MNKRKERIIALTAAVMLAGASLAGCGAADTATATTGKTAGTSAKGDESAAQGTEAKEEPVQLYVLKGAATVEIDDDAEVTKLIEERFNIDLKAFAVGQKNFEENLNLYFAGGEIPDVMGCGPGAMANYVEGGIIGEIPIEVIREKAPNYAKYIDDTDRSIWTTMMYNGKNYGIANPLSAKPFAMFWNQNWLDKLGLEVPETLEEYEEVLTAFVEQDPDGNGKKDTAGMAERAFGSVFGAFGLRCVTGGVTGFSVEQMQLGDDNVPFFPYIRPEAKQALEVLSRWYKKGIIDKEFITGENHGGYAWLSHSFMNQRIGLTSSMLSHYFLYSTDVEDETNRGLCLKEMKALDPNAKVVVGLPPIGPEGKSGTEAWDKIGNYTSMSSMAASDPRKVEAFLAMLDAYYSDVDYMELTNLGIEGKHFENTENGRVRLMDGNEVRSEGVLLVDYGDTIPFAENLAPQSNDFVKEMTGNAYYRFQAPATEEFASVIANLDTLTEQAYYDIITGEKPLDYFDTFVEEFKRTGGEVAEKAVQEAYAERMASVGK